VRYCRRAAGGLAGPAVASVLPCSRGLLLDLLATRDRAGVDAAYDRFLELALTPGRDPEVRWAQSETRSGVSDDAVR